VLWDIEDEYIVSGSYDYTLRVWEIKNDFRHAITFVGHTDNINDVCFGTNNYTVFSGLKINKLFI
jgi:WD40 repeat protein